MTERNRLVLTNISYGKGEINPVINIDVNLISRGKENKIEIYNKKYKKK